MVILKYNFTSVLSFCVVFSYTYFLGSLFVEGDQTHYRLVYDALDDLNFFEGYLFYKTVIYTDEIGHYVVTWLAAQVFDKDLFNSLVNAILAFFSVRVFMQWGAKPFVALFLVVFGYYYLALYLSAERLKYASVFFVMALHYFPNYRASYFLFLAAIITHLQYVILIVAYFFDKYLKTMVHAFSRLAIRKSDVFWLILGGAGLLGIFFLFFDHIYYKITSYHKDFDYTEYLRMLGFFVLSLYYANNKAQVISVFFVLFVLVSMVGGMRVNIFGYFVFLFYALRINGGFNFGVICTFLYFFLGWVEYSYFVINCGVNRPC